MQLSQLTGLRDEGFVGLLDLARAGPERCHLLIDGTCRRDAMGVFDLDLAGMNPTALVNPDKDGALSEAGAYIVDLGTILDNIGEAAFIRRFVTPWGKGHGVVLCGTVSTAALRRHLGKFLHLRREDDGRMVYLRFWDARIALPYFAGLADQPDRLAQWQHLGSGEVIDQILFEDPDLWPGLAARPGTDAPSQREAIRPVLPIAEIEILRAANLRRFDLTTAVGLAGVLGQAAPTGLRDAKTGPDFIGLARQDASDHGITTKAGIARWSLICTALGLRFSRHPWLDEATGQLLRARDVSESEKLQACAALVRDAKPHRVSSLKTAIRALRTGDLADIDAVFAGVHPSWYARLSPQERQAAQAHFIALAKPLGQAPPHRAAVAAALTGVIGFWWPRDPLRSTLLDQLCDKNLQDDMIATLLDKVRSELGTVGDT